VSYAAANAAPSASADGAAPAVRVAVDGLVKSYGAVHAVRDVSLRFLRGEVHALVGENGAGKSTVAKMLAGTVVPDAGAMTLDGAPLPTGSVRAARRAGVRIAFQELSLVPDWTVAENLALADGRGAARFSRRRAQAACRARLERLELDHLDPFALAGTLSLADRQQLEIARALDDDVRVLLLDEASSALTPPGVQWLFRRIRELTARGAAVVYVSHRLGEIAEIADRGTVLRDGAVAGTFTRGSWTEDELISTMAGSPAGRFFPRPPQLAADGRSKAAAGRGNAAAGRDNAAAAERASAGPAPAPALSVTRLRGEGLHDVSFDLAPGEILGIGGLQGHGQAELLRALYGAAPARAERWTVGGRAIGRLTPVRAVQAGIGFVPEDRKREGLALGLPVGENLLAPWLRQLSSGGRPRMRREQPWISRVVEALSVKTRGVAEAVGNLSGGNQQKVVFGRWLERGRRVVLLHDPTRGIDVRAKQELYDAIVRLAADGVAIVWFSTEVEELVHVCHRVLVLYRGEVARELAGDALTADAVVGAAVGQSAPGSAGGAVGAGATAGSAA
jgi:ribose transport system ATP-binding protein